MMMPTAPQRILLILPCCIGDVVMATAALSALRRAYPDAYITWAVGGWSKAAIETHPALNAVIDTGARANPVRTPRGLLDFVRQVRAGRFDLLVSFVRSPLMSIAALLTGVPTRAGLNSNGRGFGYTRRAAVDPHVPRHEGDIYLDVIRALGIDTQGCHANIPVNADARDHMRTSLERHGVGRYIVVHPGGGRNPGMTLDAKRYPPDKLVTLTDRLAEALTADVVVIGAQADLPLIAHLDQATQARSVALSGLAFAQIAALAANSVLYLGNDTGMTHLAAAAGAKTAMIMGPTDPRRYAPFTPDSIALWKPARVQAGGVSAGVPVDWDWSRDGIAPYDAAEQILSWLARDTL